MLEYYIDCSHDKLITHAQKLASGYVEKINYHLFVNDFGHTYVDMDEQYDNNGEIKLESDEKVIFTADNVKRVAETTTSIEELAQQIENSLKYRINMHNEQIEKEYNNSEFYVNVYSVSRIFGGHEEGGWYYWHYDCLESVSVFGATADDMKAHLEKVYQQYEDQIEIYIEERPMQRQTDTKPIYE